MKGKNLIDGRSKVKDIGKNTVSNGRANIRIIGREDKTIIGYWQTPILNYRRTDYGCSLYSVRANSAGATPI